MEPWPFDSTKRSRSNPERIRGIELEVAGEQRGHRVSGAERRAGMALAHALDRVHGQEADRIGHEAGIDVGYHSRSPSSPVH